MGLGGMEAIIIVFIVIGLPVICFFALIWLIIKGTRSSGKSITIEEDTRIIQEIYRGMSRMEERVDALETIILSREKKE